MARRTSLLVPLLLFFASSWQVRAQEAPPAGSDLLDVFLDCPSYLCDFDYFRTEIPFVNYVRDRQDADVHLLVTTQATGGGGTAFTVTFIGLGAFQELEETLTYTSDATATEDDVRKGLARILRAGLVRYISRTPLLDRFDITYDAPEDATVQTQAAEDPWNFWVFNTRLSGFANGEDRYRFLNIFGNVSASRVTEEVKLRFSLNGSRRSQTFELSDGSVTEDIQESFGANGLAVTSLGPHWSAGLRASGSRSTRLNYDLQAELAPAVEYDIFPYSVSTRKLLTIQYALGFSYFNYSDTTIFDRIEELHLRHTLGSVVSVKQPWGSVSLSLNGSQFFYDPSKFNLSAGGDIETRLFRGLSVDFGGYISFVRDQLYLPKGNASDEDVLLRRRELQTDWRYFFRFGIGYTFGSKFNNVVNPRFGGGGGGTFFFF